MHSINRAMPLDFPAPLLAQKTWSWWRKLFKRPPANVRERFKLLGDLLDLKKEALKKPQLSLAKSKIFGNSRRYWDLLQSREGDTFALYGRIPSSTLGDIEGFRSPYGSLVQMAVVPHFECDASQIQGIACSKSDSKSHESVDAFGAWFIDEQNRLNRKGKPPLKWNDASLKELCSHNEIRLLNGGAGDFLSVRAWDGRLFIDNSGGSHHLAGAVHVAAHIGASIPLASKLHIYRFNAKTVKWLLGGFHLVLLLDSAAWDTLRIVKNLVGSGSNMAVPSIFCEGTLLAFPKGSDLAECVMAELLDQGHHDLGGELRSAMDAQERFLTKSMASWTKYLSSAFRES